jgi:hypothetical protein
MNFIVKTRALMEQTYHIEAENEEEAKRIALENTEDVIDQAQIDAGEVLEINEAENPIEE